jgi:hypothetical protein
MFELATIRRPFGPSPLAGIDPGLVAEALLFYGQTHLVLDRSTLSGLLQSIGADNLLRLLKSGYARATYVREQEGIVALPGLYPTYSFVQIPLAGHATGARATFESDVKEQVVRTGVTDGDAKRITREFLRLVPPSKLTGPLISGPTFPNTFADEIRKHPDLLPQVRILVDHFLPGSQAANISKFYLSEVGPGRFFLNTDLNWNAAAADYANRYGTAHSKFDPSWVLSNLFTSHIELAMASKYGSDLLTASLFETLIVQRCSTLMQHRAQNSAEILEFSRQELGGGHAIREAINSGKRSFGEFLDILDRAAKFKDMLKEVNPDVGLAKTYYQEVTKDTWIDQLLPKSFRFGFFFAAGAIAEGLMATGVGMAASLGISAFDQFVLNKIARGWRPNTFVQNVLEPFVEERQ